MILSDATWHDCNSLRCCWLQDPKAWMLQAASPGEQRLPKSAALPGDRLKPGDKHGEQALLEAQPRETTLVALKAKTEVWQPGLCSKLPRMAPIEHSALLAAS